MKIIYEMPTLVQKILRTQKIRDDAKLRKSHFWVETDVAEGTLLYHTMTKEFLLLEPGEADTAETQKYLADHWFLVPEELDECKLSDELKEVVRLMNLRTKKTTLKTFTILPTTDCNARCFYCYELGCEKMTMDETMAANVATFILDKGADEVNLAWFGGEPLFNSSAIDTVCAKLTAAGRKFRSSMTTNGYLFDETIVARAVENWHLERVQITLDGTEEIYNKRKAYIYRDSGSAFLRVMDNIRLLLDAGVRVTVRMNMDERNSDDLRTLIEDLSAKFGAYSGFSAYSHLLFQDILQRKNDSTPEKLSELFSEHESLQRLLLAKGILSNSPPSRNIKMNHCMADNGRAVVILPDGTLHACEHFNECNPWGHIHTEEKDQDVLSSWNNYYPTIDDCKTCPHYPVCIRLKNCPDEPDLCLPDSQSIKTLKLRWAMESAWEKFNSEGNIPDEESEDI